MGQKRFQKKFKKNNTLKSGYFGKNNLLIKKALLVF